MFNLGKILPSDTKINFLKIKKYTTTLSCLFVILTFILIFFKGLNLGIDFKGGVLIEAEIKEIRISDLRSNLTEKFNDVTIQEFGSPNNVIIKLQNKGKKCQL